MAADAFLLLVGPYDHGQGVPPDQALDAAFHLLASREWSLLAGRNRVLVGSCGGEWQIDASFALGMQRKLLQKTASPLRAALR